MSSDSAISQTTSAKTQLILLGTGTPNADPDRSGPSLAIVVGDTSYIVDFGPGLVRRAASLSQNRGGPFEALNPDNLKIAFLTHLHSDHTAGYVLSVTHAALDHLVGGLEHAVGDLGHGELFVVRLLTSFHLYLTCIELL